MTNYSRALGRPDLTGLDSERIDDLLDAVEPETSPVVVYLGKTEVAHYLGLRSMRSMRHVVLPPHDAVIGGRKGWLPETIDAWNATRPGRGRWGARSES